MFAGTPEVLAAQRAAIAGVESTARAESAGVVVEHRYAPFHDDAGRPAGAVGILLATGERSARRSVAS
ncbi:MAG: hypothetical protein ACRDF0_06995 [Candidatus Limnocylindria bacterium]